jgi:DNA-binding MurR/RpiR family transcriptional regulator
MLGSAFLDGSEQLLGSGDYDQLSPKQQLLARVIAENPSFAAFATASRLAKRAGTSTATVIRFAQALGFAGYEEFQQNIRHDYLRTLRPLEVLQTRNQNGRNTFEAQLYQDIENLRLTLHSLHTDLLSGIAQRIHSARQTVIISSGSYSSMALVLGHHLRFMGYQALVEDRGGPHLTAAIAPLANDDLVIGISFWKGSREIVQAVEWASSRDIPTAAFTDTVYSPLAKAADICAVLPTEGVSFFQSMVAPMSIAYGIVAHLAHQADADRKQVMTEAEQSYELLDISVSK